MLYAYCLSFRAWVCDICISVAFSSYGALICTFSSGFCLWRLRSVCIDRFLSAFSFSCLGLGSVRIGGIFMLGGRLVMPVARLFVLLVLVAH